MTMSYIACDRLYWPDGKRKCLTLSYDDGVTQDLRLLEILNRHGVKAAFNLNPGLFGEEDKVTAGKKEVSHIKLKAQDIIATYQGQEIAAHGYLHTSLYGCDSAVCVKEIMDSRAALEELLGRPITGYAYAFGANDETVVSAARQCGIRYGRTIHSTGKFDIPENFLLWNPTCHHDDERLFELLEEFLSDEPYFNFFSPAKLFYVWGHAYEFDQCDNWDRIEEFVEKASGREDVWYATNEEIERYVRAYKNLIFSADSKFVTNPSAIPVWIGGMFENKSLCIAPGDTKALLPKVKM